MLPGFLSTQSWQQMSEIACPNTHNGERLWALTEPLGLVYDWLVTPEVSTGSSSDLKCLQSTHTHWQEHCSQARRIRKFNIRELLRCSKLFSAAVQSHCTLKYLLAKPYGDVFSCHRAKLHATRLSLPGRTNNRVASAFTLFLLCIQSLIQAPRHTPTNFSLAQPTMGASLSLVEGEEESKLGRGWVPFLWQRLRIPLTSRWKSYFQIPSSPDLQQGSTLFIEWRGRLRI